MASRTAARRPPRPRSRHSWHTANATARSLSGRVWGTRSTSADRSRSSIRVESETFARKVGLVIPQHGALGPTLAPYRTRYLDAMRAYQRGEFKKAMRSWTLAYLVRHSAFHTMDHAWEMEDKDLS